MSQAVRRAAAILAAAVLWSTTASAQAVPDSTARRQQRALDSLGVVLRALQARIDTLIAAGAQAGAPAEPVDELAALRAAASAATADSTTGDARPQQARLGQNALNPQISVTGDFRASRFEPGPQADAYTVREFEFGFQSALDPYATAKITMAVGTEGASIEEGYVYFPVLPGHVRMDLGRFRQQVGELNRWHLHAAPEDQYPLVIRRYGGDEGISGTGVSLYWPLPFSGRLGTYEVYVQGTTGDNAVLYASGNRPAVSSQLSGFWQLSRSTYVMASVSGAYGTNPDSSLTSALGVLAGRLTWRPPQQGQARELTVRGELWRLQRKVAGTGPARLGWYADATWKLNRRYTAGVRYDRVADPAPGPLVHEWAVTPTLTYWQSEFVFLRALWEHARDTAGATRDRLTIQAVFAMGPHKHELF